MNRLKLTLIFFGGLFIGLLLANLDSFSPTDSQPAPSVASASPDSETLKTLREKFASLSENEINEYIQLKNMKAKFEKADEIFGKILSIFLLDLGLRVSEARLGELKASIAADSSVPLPPSESPPASARAPAPKSSATAKKSLSDELAQLDSEAEVKKLLDESALKDPVADWRRSPALDPKQIQLVNGKFDGMVQFFDKEEPALDLTMDSKAKIESGVIEGQMTMKVSGRGGGRNAMFKTLPLSEDRYFRSGPDGSILLEAVSANGMFQLYYVPRMNQFFGNYYEKKGLDAYKRAGTVLLSKSD